MPALTAQETKFHLKAVPDWSNHARVIGRTFKFNGFGESIAFVNHVAEQAQKLNHHPEINICFDKVTLKLTTHDEGGVTEKDFLLARHCDAIFSKFPPRNQRPSRK